MNIIMILGIVILAGIALSIVVPLIMMIAMFIYAIFTR